MAVHPLHLDELAAPNLASVVARLALERDEADGCGTGRLVHVAREPSRPARHGALDRPLPPPVAARAGALWTHQAEAIDLVRRGRSVVVATATGSGKSRCYQLPIAEAALAPIRPGTALCLFPTKALAHDQLRAFTDLELGLAVGAYDGDASPEERTWIRKQAAVVLTNPEMLHAGLLPHHERWATFLGRLRYVVVDELHVFRGVFGSHVAQVLRRLRRLAVHHGADPVFICCSATIGAPERLAAALTGVDVIVVDDDGSPQGERAVAIWQPPLLDADSGRRASAHRETAAVMAGLIDAGHPTLGFARSRRGVELVAADVRRRLPPVRRERVRAYRGGYLAEERREIEDELAGGDLDGVVATSALELGIDVGALDAVVVDGFPGTIASFRQQAGRAGRNGDSSLAVLVAGDDQLDQWLVAHPRELHDRGPEPAIVNPANPYVLDPHLRCAAHELPLSHDDDRWWPGLLDDGVRRLVHDGELLVRVRGRRREPIAVFDGAGWPSHDVGLRNAGGGPIKIVTASGERPVGEVDRARAPEQLHASASYLHQGQHWRVVELDLAVGRALVEPDDGATYTVTQATTAVRLVEVDATRAVGTSTLALGTVEVHGQVTGYLRKEAITGDVVERVPLELPATTLTTRAFWYVIPPSVVEAAGLALPELPGALHAAEHAAIGMLPRFAICDRWDVGGLSTAVHADTGQPTIIVYDALPGGSGVAELGFEAADGHLLATEESIRACPCSDGCPSCVQSPKCGNANEHLDKAAALRLLAALLRAATSPNALSASSAPGPLVAS